MVERVFAPLRGERRPWRGILFFSSLTTAFVLLCWSAYQIERQHRELARAGRANSLMVIDVLARAFEGCQSPAGWSADSRAATESRAHLLGRLVRPRGIGATPGDAAGLESALRRGGREGVEETLQILSRHGIVSFAVLRDVDGSVLATAGRPGGGDGTLTLQRVVSLAANRAGTLQIEVPPDESHASQAGELHRSFAISLSVAALVCVMTVVAIIAKRDMLRQATRERSLTKAVLMGMSDGVVVLDSEDRVRLSNPAACRLLDTSSTQLIGKNCRETPFGGIVGEFTPTVTVQEVEVRRDEGPSTPVRAVVAPLRDASEVLGRAVILSDLTDACRFEREQRRARSLVAFGRFASMVAHEIRNPLNAIAVGVQRLALEGSSTAQDPGAKRLLALVREEVERLDRILGNFLDLSRPPRLDPRPGDLDAVIAATMPLLQQDTPSAIRLTHSRNGGVEAVFDPQAVRQVLLNLVHNAVEALVDRGRVEIVTRREGRSAILEVRDDGPGIPSEDHEHVFELGFTTKPAGHGLGLPIVHRLVAEMHGGLEIGSVPGKGTTMRVYLPVPERVDAA